MNSEVIPPGWRYVRTGELCDISRGSSPRPIGDWLTLGEGVPWVKISDLPDKSRFIVGTKERILFSGESKSKTVIPGDLILTNSATPGIPIFMDINACIHDGWMLLRNFRDVDKLFFYYLLITSRRHLLRQVTGAVFDNLKIDILANHKILLPPMPTQEKIVSVLDSLDTCIEKKSAISSNISLITSILFRSWFIDFDPVKAKAKGELPYGMDEETAALFPDSFEDSEFGQIPTGWRFSSISKICKMSSGGTPKRSKKEYFSIQGVGYPWLASRELNGNFIHDTEEYISELGLKNSSAKLFPENSVAMAMYGATAGRIGYFAKAMTTSQAICVMSAKENICLPKYLYFLIKSESWKIVWINAIGGAQPNISQHSIGKHRIVLPPFEIIQKFESVINELFANVDTLSTQSEKLSDLRDVLLPRLMSGELKLN